MRVLVLGYGEMGHAMETLLAPRHALDLWQRRPPAGSAVPPLETLAASADIVLFCVPATAHAALATRLAARLAPSALCLTIAKGLDDTGHTPAEILFQGVGVARSAVLYGPMIAEEIRAGRAAFAQCGIPDDDAGHRIAALFAGSSLHLETARDIPGLSWSAILKNVYALAFGMADALALGDNVRGLLAVAALHELAALARQLGGDERTPYRLAGLGDLITTATSSGSHHYALGRRLARQERDRLTGEGVHTLAVLRAHPRLDLAHFPLLRLIGDCVHEPQDVRARLTLWLNTALAGS